MNTPNFIPVINAAYRLTRAVRRVNSFTTTPFGTWVVVLDVDLSTHDCLVPPPIQPSAVRGPLRYG